MHGRGRGSGKRGRGSGKRGHVPGRDVSGAAAAGPERRAANWALVLEYDGTEFVGWQRQANGLTIQAVLEAAAARLAGGAAVGSVVAGRTDAGVHAAGQVALLRRLPDPAGGPWDARRLRDALNFHMKPHPVVVLRAAAAPPDWNPRFSAVMRRYRYAILNRRARPTLERDAVWHVNHPLDAGAMRDGARHLLGRHDFSAFRATACQAKSPVRTLDRLEVARDGDRVLISAEARSFLHHQVRNMVGALAMVGLGDWPPERIATVLAGRDRRDSGPTAPASGLTLVSVTYPGPFVP